jgi:hypothetical protein
VTRRVASGTAADLRIFWTLRVLESGLLLSALVGIGLFAWSLVDIVRIETTASAAGQLPQTAWPGIFLFAGSLVLLQLVRGLLQPYRREDGTPRRATSGIAPVAAATAEVLASIREETEPVADAADIQGEG